MHVCNKFYVNALTFILVYLRMIDEIQKEVLLMAKITENYESMVVFSTKAGDEAVAELVAKFKELIEANATLAEVDEWGKRKLAYDINYESEGYYVVYTFESKPDFPAELSRVLNITDGVLRSIVISK